MNKTIELIKSRVSCRSYSDKKVPASKLNQILEAGKYAPSGRNRQCCNILVIKNKKLLKQISDALIAGSGRDCLYGAKTFCIVYGKKDEPLMVQDASCILENMFIAATALKIDSCWINQMEDMLSEPRNKKIKDKLGLTDEDRIVGSIILGYRKEGTNIPVKPRKEDFIRYL